MKNKKLSLALIIFLLMFNSCSYRPATEINGVINLDVKEKTLKPLISNKNDVVLTLGESIAKEYPDENTWLYFETVNKRNFLGKKIYIKNNVLIIDFDNKGIILTKKLLNSKDLKELELDEELSKEYAVDNSALNKFFYSLRKRVQNQKNKFKKK